MTTHLLGSTILMGLLFVLVLLTASRLSARSEPAEASSGELVPLDQRVSSTVDSPAGLGAIFVVLTLTLGVLTLVAIGGFESMTVTIPNVFVLVSGFIGLLLLGFLFLGSYVVVREHGFGPAQGIAAGLFGLGGALILLIAANLVFGLVG